MSEAAAGTAASTRTTTDTATAAAAAATTTAAAAARYAAGRAFFDSQPQDLPAAKVELEAAYEAAYFRVYDAHAPTAAAPAVDSPAAAAAARQLVDIAWYLAQTLHCLDEHAPALPCLELCCGLLIAIPNYAPSELAECFIYKAHVEVSLESFDAAIASFEKAVEILEKRRNDPAAQQRLGDALHELADAVYFQGEGNAAAIKMQRDVVELLVKNGQDDMDAADLLSSIAMTKANVQGDFDAAYADFGRALEIEREELGENDIQTAITLNNMAMVKRKKGDYDRAMELYMDALAVRKKASGARSADVAATMTNMAAVWYYEGDFDMAIKLYHEALQMRKDLGLTAAAADTLGNMAIVCDFQGKYDDAVGYYDQAIELLSTSELGYESVDAAYSLCGKAVVVYKKGSLQESLSIFKESLRIFDAVLGADHPYTADAFHGMAQVMYSQHDYDRATELFKQALEIRRRALGVVHPSTYKTLLWITETGRRSRSLIQGASGPGSGDAAEQGSEPNNGTLDPTDQTSSEKLPVVRKNLQEAIAHDAHVNGPCSPPPDRTGGSEE